ncbi:MAG: 50S ribosomal protein L18 [Pseudomonadota bacterium]
MGVFRRTDARIKRKKRVRKKVRGVSDKPRLCVFRSERHVYAQIIDDTAGRTLVEASSLSKGLAPKIGRDGGNKKGAALVGTSIAERAVESGIKKVVFDRNGFLYHGRVRALAEAAREAGLDF